jgi:hypothetical protein
MRRGTILFLVIIALTVVALMPMITCAIYEILPFDFLLAIPDIVWWFVFWPLTLFFLIYFVLAPRNMFFTLIDEGRAKIVVKAKGFNKCLIQWKGQTFDYKKPHPEKWTVLEEKPDKGIKEPWHIFGGLRFYGLWPIWDIHAYKFKWTSIAEGGQPKSRKEWLAYVLLKEDVYFVEISDAEDKNLLPLKIELVLTVRIINPYKARFNIQDWLEAVVNRTQPLVRRYVASKEYSSLIEELDITSEDIENKLKEENLIGDEGEFYKDYGVLVRKIEIRQINPPDKWRETTLLKYKSSQEKIRIETLAKARAKEIDLTFSEAVKKGPLGVLMFMSTKEGDLSGLAQTLYLPQFMRYFDKPEQVTLEDLQKLRESLETRGVPDELVRMLVEDWQELKKVIDEMVRR